jgi:hypothetical protein
MSVYAKCGELENVHRELNGLMEAAYAEYKQAEDEIDQFLNNLDVPPEYAHLERLKKVAKVKYEEFTRLGQKRLDVSTSHF